MTAGDGGSGVASRAAIDGLRALAVLAVLGFHGDVGWLRGGFLGVSLFFTISGFLVTTLLLTEWRSAGRIALGSFWARRARRLLPSAWLTVVAALVLTSRLGSDVQRSSLAGDAGAALGHGANWRFLLAEASYDTQLGGKSALLHFWSLAIEEQFYLVWPLLVVGVLTFAHRRGRRGSTLLGAVIGAGIVASGVASALSSSVDRSYYGTDTRAAELLAGAALAVAVHRRPDIVRLRALPALTVVAVALLGLAAAVVTVDDTVLQHGGRLGIAALSVVAVAGAWGEHPVARVLGVAPLRAIGRVSYTLYLAHWPIYLFVDAERTDLDGGALLALRVALSVAVAIVVYHAFECPWRFRRVVRGRVAEPAVAAVALAAIVTGIVALPSVRVARVDAVAEGVDAYEPRTTTDALVIGAGAATFGPELERDDRWAVTVAGAHDCPLAVARAWRETPAASATPVDCAPARSGWTRAGSAHGLVVVAPGPVDVADALVDGTWHPAADLDRVTALDRALTSLVLPLVATDRVVVLLPPPSGTPATEVVRGRLAALADDAIGITLAERADAAAVAVAYDAATAETVPPWPQPYGDAAPSPLRVLVVGDSTSFWVSVGLVRAAEQGADVEVLWAGAAACPVVRVDEYRGLEDQLVDAGACPRFDEDWVAAGRAFHPDVVFVVASTIDGAVHDLGHGAVAFGDPAFDAFWRSEADAAVAALAETGAVVVWADAPTVSFAGAGRSQVWNDRLRRYDELVGALAADWSQVELLSLSAHLGAPGSPVDRRLRPDGVHLAPEAAVAVALVWLVDELRAAWTRGARAATAAGCFGGRGARPTVAIERCGAGSLSAGSGSR